MMHVVVGIVHGLG